jgi:hypothetical protein
VYAYVDFFIKAALWKRGLASARELMGCEIESGQGIGW